MLSSEDIITQPFTKVFRGYDVQEVDLFLDEVIRTLEQHEQQRDVLLSRIEALLAELDHTDALLSAANAAQETSDAAASDSQPDTQAQDDAGPPDA